MQHSITFNNQRYHSNSAMEIWCAENIGKGSWIEREDHRWHTESMFGNTIFKFKDERDLAWFILRWGAQNGIIHTNIDNTRTEYKHG